MSDGSSRQVFPMSSNRFPSGPHLVPSDVATSHYVPNSNTIIASPFPSQSSPIPRGNTNPGSRTIYYDPSASIIGSNSLSVTTPTVTVNIPPPPDRDPPLPPSSAARRHAHHHPVDAQVSPHSDRDDDDDNNDDGTGLSDNDDDGDDDDGHSHAHRRRAPNPATGTEDSDGTATESSAEARRAARRKRYEEHVRVCQSMYYMGFALLPWLWLVNFIYFRRLYNHHSTPPVMRATLRKCLVGFIVCAALFIAWSAVYVATGDKWGNSIRMLTATRFTADWGL